MLATVNYLASSFLPSTESKTHDSVNRITVGSFALLSPSSSDWSSDLAISLFKRAQLAVSSFDLQLNHVPDEILVIIFNQLPVRDRLIIRRVCRRWNRLALCNINELFVGRVHSKLDSTDVATHNQINFNNSYIGQQTARFLLHKCGRSLRTLHLHRIDFSVGLLKSSETESENVSESFNNSHPPNHITTASSTETNSYLLSMAEDTRTARQPMNQPNGLTISMMNVPLCSIIRRNCIHLTSLTLSHCVALHSDIVTDLLKSIGNQLIEFRLRQTHEFDLIPKMMEHLNRSRLLKLSLFIDQESTLVRICGHFKRLEHLEVMAFTPLSFRPLVSLAHLKSFRLRNHHCGVADLQQLLAGDLPRTLRSLRMNGMLLCTPEQMKPLAELSSLRHLQLVITDNNQLQFVFHHLTQLESLDLCLQLYPRHNRLVGLGSLRSLRTLRIKCHNISWLRLEQLAPMPNLRSLSLLGRYFCHSLLDGGRFLRNLPHICPNLKHLKMTDQWSMPRVLTDSVGQLHHLRHLQLMVDREQADVARQRLLAATRNLHISLLCCTRRTFSSFAFTNRYHCLVPKSLQELHS